MHSVQHMTTYMHNMRTDRKGKGRHSLPLLPLGQRGDPLVYTGNPMSEVGINISVCYK